MTSRPSVDDIFFDKGLGSIIPPAAQRHHRDETTLRRQVTQLELGINMFQQVRLQRSPKYTYEVQPLRAVLLCVCSTLFVHDLSSGKALYLSRKRIVCAGVRHHQQEERLHRLRRLKHCWPRPAARENASFSSTNNRKTSYGCLPQEHRADCVDAVLLPCPAVWKTLPSRETLVSSSPSPGRHHAEPMLTRDEPYAVACTAG